MLSGLGFLEEMFIPSRCSVSSTPHYSEPAKDELLVQESMKPAVVSSPCSGSWLSLCYSILSLCSVPCSSQICVFRPLHFCAISLSFLPLFLQLFTCISISGPALESTSKCLFPKPTGSIIVFYTYLPNRATLLPKQSFYPLTHAF